MEAWRLGVLLASVVGIVIIVWSLIRLAWAAA